jgi:tetratricopeptide (TPR) repeat protein
LSKTRRADLHERIAGWLDKRRDAMAADPDQFVGHHLAQAVLLRRDLGPLDAAGVELAHQAADRLATAARHLERADPATAARLLEHATDLVGESSPDWPPLQQRLATLLWTTFENPRAIEAARRLVEVAARHRDQRWAIIARATWTMFREDLLGETASTDDLARLDTVLQRFRAANDPQGILYVANAKAHILFGRGWHTELLELNELRARAAQQLGDDFALETIAVSNVMSLFWGLTPVPQALTWISELIEIGRPVTSNLARLGLRNFRATLLAYDDRPDEARSELDECRALAEDLNPFLRVSRSSFWADTLLAVGDAAGAERVLDRVVRHLVQTAGYEAHLATLGPKLGQLCYRRGDHEAAGHWLELGRGLAAEHDLDAQVRWRALKAKLEAGKGSADTALRLADEAVELVKRGEDIVLQAQCHADRAEVLHLAGRDHDAVAALHDALDCYRRKGHKPGARSIQARIGELDRRPTTA